IGRDEGVVKVLGIDRVLVIENLVSGLRKKVLNHPSSIKSLKHLDIAPPEITVDRSWVHAGEGHEAQLSCTVHGETNPEITWYQDSFPIQQSDRKLMDFRGEKHSLIIKNVQVGDFGNYSCIADNSLGRAKKYIELSGKPGPANFLSPVYGRSRDSYNLTWAVQSWPPLEEVRLMYRKLMAASLASCSPSSNFLYHYTSPTTSYK
ncbi:myosin light chain kinase, smooth muscle-like, partial [Ctenocephalides felis]|uniref:myosin light chain kinase, smooth muscle-like n=1 Tax=Ctenocephalides felis TaxID=7515 RepID=UPI000E6E223A